jgi:Domain of unknown function (DUF5919)
MPVDWKVPGDSRHIMSQITDEPPSNHDYNIMSRLKHRVYRYRVVLVALGLFIIGLFFITLAAFIPASEADPVWSQVSNHILRDLGIAAIISALLGSAYEYWIRGDFTEDAKQGLRSVVTEERQHLKNEFSADAQSSLRSVLEERDNRLQQLDKFDAADLKGIHEGLNSDLLKEKFSNVIEKAQSNRGDDSTPPPTVRILDTWTDLGGWGIWNHIEEAASNGCRVEMLLLDPRSDHVKYRAEAMDNSADFVKGQILEELQTLRRLSFRLQESDNRNLEVKVYDAAPTNHIYDFDGTMLIGLYWRKSPSYSGPQIEIVAEHERSSETELVRRIHEQFDDLWTHSKTHASEVVKKLGGDSNKRTDGGLSEPGYLRVHGRNNGLHDVPRRKDGRTDERNAHLDYSRLYGGRDEVMPFPTSAIQDAETYGVSVDRVNQHFADGSQ